MMTHYWKAFVFASRLLWKKPGQTLLAVLALGLGIGLVSTQFSLADGILLRGLPFKQSSKILHVTRLNPQTMDPNNWEFIPYRDFEQFRNDQTSFQSVAAVASFGANVVREDGVPMSHSAAHVSSELLNVLGENPMLGRWFESGETEANQPGLVVLSHRLWQNDFGSDPSILGKGFVVNGEPTTIIGVMPEGFMFPNRQQFWMNMRNEAVDPREKGAMGVEMVGRLARGVSAAEAKAELDGLAARLETLHPETNEGYRFMNVAQFAHAYAGTGTKPLLFALLAMTGFILLLACINVANLLVARAVRRSRELAIRQALGAGRFDLIRQLMCESLLLSSLGAIVGIALAYGGTLYLQRTIVNQMNVPFWFDFRVDHRLLLFILALTFATGIIAGLLPALKASRVDVNEALKDDSRGTSSISMGRFFKWLVCGQVTLSAALLIVAGVQAQLVVKLRHVNMPFDPDQLMMGRLEIQDAIYATPEARVQFYDRLLERVRQIPGVSKVAVSSRNLVFGGVNARCEIDGRTYANDNEKPMTQLEVVSQDYFDTIGVSVLTGRAFDSRDRIGSPEVALVNQSFAAKFWPNDSAIGKRIRHNETGANWATVVGVVPDLSMQGLMTGPGLASEGFYLCEAQKAWGWLNLLVRTEADPGELVDDLRAAVAAVDPQQPIHSFGTLAEQTRRQMQGFEVIGTQVLIFGMVTVFLGAVGIYGVTAFSVGQRSREFGVRMALGATAGSILKLVFRQGSLQIVIGLVLGTILAILLTLPTQVVVPQVSVNYTAVMIVVLGMVAVIASLAMWVPARRASRANPLDALRHD